MERTATIRLNVNSNQNGVQAIQWEADDAPQSGMQEAQAMILALWDGDERNAMRIDLWTPRMTIHDMNDFVYQTLLSLADSYHRATNNDNLLVEMKMFARSFAEQASAHEQRVQRSG